MILRNTVLFAGLVVFLAGCVVVAQPGQPHRHDTQNDNRPRDIQSAPSYEGYFYARVVFINNVPYYVYDDRNVRPIQPRLHNHFRKYSYGTIREPLIFSRDTEVREGYAISRIVYLNGVPYYVTDDRNARPLPGHLHPRFKYAPSQAGTPMDGSNQQPPVARNDDRRNEAPAYGRERNEPPTGQGRRLIDVPADARDRARFGQPPFGRAQGDKSNPEPPVARNDDPASSDDRPNQPPANGVGKDNGAPPVRGWNHERMARPPLERQQHDQRRGQDSARSQADIMPPAASNAQRPMPPMNQQQANLRQGQRNADKARGGAPADNGRNRGHAQAVNDTNKKESDKKESPEGKEGEKGSKDKKSARGSKEDERDVDADNAKGKKGD